MHIFVHTHTSIKSAITNTETVQTIKTGYAPNHDSRSRSRKTYVS